MKNSQASPSISPYFAISIGILAVSTSSLFIRYAQTEVNSLVISAYRLSIAALILAPIALWKYRRELLSLTKKDLQLGILSGVFLALHFATWISSLEYTTVTSSVVLVSTTPLWVALFSPITIKEPTTRVVVIGMSIAMIGTLIVGFSDVCQFNSGITCPSANAFFQGQAFLGDLLALIGAWMAAGYVLIGRKLRNKLAVISYVFLVYSIAAILLIAIVISTKQQLTGFSNQIYLWLFLLAVLPQLIGHSIFNWALGYLSAGFVSITLLGDPIASVIIAYIFLSEIPGPIKLFGAILILGGIMIASKNKSESFAEN